MTKKQSGGSTLVSWSCKKCGQVGAIETIIHPYSLGIIVFRAHGEVSPNCKFGLNDIEYSY